jgi:hypothetical protein
MWRALWRILALPDENILVASVHSFDCRRKTMVGLIKCSSALFFSLLLRSFNLIVTSPLLATDAGRVIFLFQQLAAHKQDVNTSRSDVVRRLYCSVLHHKKELADL